MPEQRTSPVVLAATFVAGVLVTARVALDYAVGMWLIHFEANRMACTVVGALLALALAHGIWAATTAGNPHGAPRAAVRTSIWWLWVVVLVNALLALPAAFPLGYYPLASLLVVGSLLAFPAAYIDRPAFREPSHSLVTLLASSYRRLPYVLVFVAFISAVIYFRSAQHSIGSVDFFYYVCFARDMLAFNEDVSDHCYAYFPGVYAYWRATMRVFGPALSNLQLSYTVLLVTNALLVAAVVARVTRRCLASCVAAIWYLVLTSRFEGLAGVSEPLATAALLLGCLLWAGGPLRGNRGVGLALLLGMAMGLTVYAKQQAGLLTLGAISMLVLRPATPDSRRHGWLQLILLPLIAAATLIVAILMEAKGWIPVREGLTFASDYAQEGSLLRNLYPQIRGDESAALAAVFMILGWCILLCKKDRREWIDTRHIRLGVFAMFAFLFSLFQFSTRPYGHYMLLGIPWLVLACVLLVHFHTLRPHAENSSLRPLLPRVMLILAVAFLFFHTSARHNTLYVWRWFLPQDFRANELWHEHPACARDIAAASTAVRPGSKMYILPPRRNSIYFLLGTRTANPNGYTFVQADLKHFPWHECRYFVLLTNGLNEFDYQFTTAAKLDSTRQILIDKGYQLRDDIDLVTMELYERPGS